MAKEKKISNGAMLNAYPDSIGMNLQDMVTMLQMPEFKDVFSLFYVLPTFFNSDLDRGFSVIDYDINKELVSEADLKALDALKKLNNILNDYNKSNKGLDFGAGTGSAISKVLITTMYS